MYLQEYGLQRPPFDAVLTDNFFVESPAEQAVNFLHEAVLHTSGVILFSGPAGTGKTTALRMLSPPVPKAMILTTPADALEIAQLSCIGTCRGPTPKTVHGCVALLAAQQKRPLIVVDNANRLCADCLAFIESAVDMAGVTVILAADNVHECLTEDLAKHVRTGFELRDLTQLETQAYIDSRLIHAGAEDSLFTEDGHGLLFETTGGNPRALNRLCDQVLYACAGSSTRPLTADMIQGCL